jgi:hypothetical protein
MKGFVWPQYLVEPQYIEGSFEKSRRRRKEQGADARHPSVFVEKGFRRAWGILTETDEVSLPLWVLR